MGDLALRQICMQRKQRQENPILPSVRLNLASPYRNETTTGEFLTFTGFTKRQLDMRRKVEILKYQNNNGKTTAKQQFSLLALSSSSTSRRSSDNDCMYLPTKTSSSNIPGPIIELTYDDSIPLYNYLQRQLAVGTLPATDTTLFRFHKLQGQTIELDFVRVEPGRYDMATPVTIGYLQIYESITSSLTSFQLTAILKFTDITGYAVTPKFNGTDDLKIFFSETEMSNKKQIDTACYPVSTTDTVTVTTAITLLPTVDGNIYKLQYYFTEFAIPYAYSNPLLKCSIDPADITVQIII